jgi:hypothetical protein
VKSPKKKRKRGKEKKQVELGASESPKGRMEKKVQR